MTRPGFDSNTRKWRVTPEDFAGIREDALEDEILGRDPGLRYFRIFGPGPVEIIVVLEAN